MEGESLTLKRLTSLFVLNWDPFNGQIIKNKNDLELVTRFWNKFRKIPLTKFDGVIWSSFWAIPKITSANLSQPINDIINYSTSICSFESGKCGKERKKFQTFECLEKEKSFFDETKNNFIVFEGLSFGQKVKLW